jgi:TRAP-type C4-dicarboxylate transport system substrate-binding protein
MLRPWKNEIARSSGGSLTIEIHPNLNPVAQYKFAADGKYDLSTGLTGYTSELFPRTGILELPGIAETAEEAVDKFWDAFPLIEPEWKGVKLLALWTNHRNLLMFRGKPIRAIADLKGRKIRVPSKAKGDIIKPLGMTPVFIPITRVNQALRSGAIDGVLTSPSAIRYYKLNEVVTSYWGSLPVGFATFFLAMNRKVFESLIAEHKVLIKKTTGRELSKRFARFFMKNGKGGLSIVRRSTTISTIKLPVGEQAKGAAILEKVLTDRIVELEKAGIPAKRIAKAMGVGS